ncbi:MAG: phosphoglycerate kinase [Alphaproteobacteria bacterium]|nr:phosphoglycerate kinase [Alphaproteobacteria bacterium]
MTKTFKTIDDFDVKGKRVLVRADLNVPMKDGKVTDLTRLERTAPTILELAKKGARVVVLAHFGRPKGKPNAEMSLKPVAEALAKVVGRAVPFAEDCVGPKAANAVARLRDGDVAVMENLRFYAEEEKNDPTFAGKLAELGNIYVNDAFSCAHRAHASTEGIARLLPAAAGRLMQAELEALGRALEAPKRPVAALVGGAKVSTKMDVLGNLAARVDVLIIGGGMANTFLFADGVAIGKSLCEKEMADQARAIRETARKRGCQVVLPVDAAVAAEFKEGAASAIVALNAVPADKMILDVGPQSIAAVNKKLAECQTLVWNGPMGAFEIPPFDAGTNGVAREAARLTKAGKLLSVAGGGDTVAALAHAGVVDDFSYVSTAGGAFLEWLEGKDLPGVAILKAMAKA